MKQKFIECKYYYQARKLCPWACKIAKVIDGFICFESEVDYGIWKNQK